MSDHKAQVEQKAARIIEWLKEHRAEFEGEGVNESSLGAATGISEDEVTEAVDYLENHEDVVRYPHGLLKPGRNWPAIREEAAGV